MFGGNGMGFLILAIVAIALACATLWLLLNKTALSRGWAVIPAALLAAVVAFACVYPQDAGEVCVRINMGGSLDGYSEEAGFHLKAPWQSVVSYDVRNNIISLHKNDDYEFDGGDASGACVTVNDKGGATADVDIQVIYSLDGDSALKLYEDYGTQAALTEKSIINDVRAVTREVAGGLETIDMLTNRGRLANGVRESLSSRWKKMGLGIEQVSVQDIQYSKGIQKQYDAAQKAVVAQSKALNEQETERIKAATKKIKADGEAAANNALTASLTPEILTQRYIDALAEIAGKEGNLIVIPEGSTPLVSVGE